MNGSGIGIGSIFIASKTTTITHIGVRQATKVGVAPTYRFAIEGVTTTRQPDGTVAGSGTAKFDQADPVNGFTWYTLDTPLSVTQGDNLSVTARYLSGTIDASHTITLMTGGGTISRDHQPFYCTLSGGTWTGVAGLPSLSVKYADGTVPYGMMPHTATTSNSWSSAGSPLYRGTLWVPTFNGTFSSVYIGVRVADGGNFTLSKMKDSSASPIFTKAYEASKLSSLNTSVGFCKIPCDGLAFVAGSSYRFMISPTTATAITTLMSMTFPDQVSKNAMYGTLSYSTATSLGAYSDDTLTVIAVIPALDTIETNGGSII